MDARLWMSLLVLLTVSLAGCASNDDDGPSGGGVPGTDSDGDGITDAEETVQGSDPLDGSQTTGSQAVVAEFTIHTLPSEFPGHGLYEPTIDVGPEGNIYVSAHSQNVGQNPSPSYYSLDDGETWHNMALFATYQDPDPSNQMSAPLFSDEVYIVAGEEGEAWGVDCCVTGHFPLIGWCADGAEVCYYNQNAYDHSKNVIQAVDCQPLPVTDRPYVAYNNGMLIMVNNPGGGPMQIASMTVPPLTPVAYGGIASQIDWNLCASDGGHIPGNVDMRPDHFFAASQPSNFQLSEYHVVVGYATDVQDVRQVHLFSNSHVPPAEDDSTPAQVTRGGQPVFDAEGTLYVATMNNTNGTAQPGAGGIHFATSTDDATTFTETTFRFNQPVSSIYLDGNRKGPGLLLNWGVIDGDHTDWYMGHVFRNDDNTLTLTNVMLAVDDGPEASRHIQGAALGPDGRAYMVMSENSSNPGGATSEVGDTPMKVVVQQSGPTLGPSVIGIGTTIA